MHDKQLERALDSWGDSERLSTPPMPEALRAGLGRIRVRRAAAAGAAVVAATALVAAIVLTRAPREPQPVPEPAPIVEPMDEMSIGAIYSQNNMLNGPGDEIVLPKPTSFGPVEPVRRTIR